MTENLCKAAQLQASTGRSVQGRTLWLRDINAQPAARRVLVVGAIHGDELSAAVLAFHWIQLAAQTPTEATARIHWRFLPVLNPDGLLHQPPRRVNARGVDLNRNFPTPHWIRETKTYWESRTGKDPRRWPGAQPLSEPESQFLHKEMQGFKPQLIVSIHAPYGVLDFDGPAAPPSRLGRLQLNQVGIFPGSLGNYSGLHQGMPVITVELPHALQPPKNAEIRQMWRDLLRWINNNIAPTRPTP